MSRTQHAAGDFIDAIADAVTERVAARVVELLQVHEPQPAATRAHPAYLTPKETATRFRLHLQTLQQFRRVGGGPPFHRAGRKILYRADEVESWLRSAGNNGDAVSEQPPTVARRARASAQRATT